MRNLLYVLALSSLLSYAVHTHGASDPAGNGTETYGRGRIPEYGLPAIITSDDELLRVLSSDPDAQSLQAAEDYINKNWLKSEALGNGSRIKLSKYKIPFNGGTYGINVSNPSGNSQVSSPIDSIITDGIDAFKRTVRRIGKPR